MRTVGLAALVQLVEVLLKQVKRLFVELVQLLGGGGFVSTGGTRSGLRDLVLVLFGVRVHG